MKKILGALALSLLVAGSAAAADLPVRMPVKAPPMIAPPFSWTGFYIGGNAGGGWSRNSFVYTDYGISVGGHDADGAVAGGQIGYNIQSGQFVFGLEFSGDWADISGSNTDPVNTSYTFHSKLDSILLATGRVGVAFDRALLYATGGAAWGFDKFGYTNSTRDETIKQTRTGWTVGGGIEYAFTPNWSIAGQYNYIDFGNKTSWFPIESNNIAHDQTVQIATVRLNYRFGWGGPVVARY